MKGPRSGLLLSSLHRPGKDLGRKTESPLTFESEKEPKPHLKRKNSGEGPDRRIRAAYRDPLVIGLAKMKESEGRKEFSSKGGSALRRWQVKAAADLDLAE